MQIPNSLRNAFSILFLGTVLVLAGALPSAAGEVDLAAAGCPDLPEAGRFMSVHLVLDGAGNGRDCTISSEFEDFCERFHSFEDGVLCLGLTHNPRPDITAAETRESKTVDRLIVDGVDVEESYGKTILRKDLATGPSGETYDVVVEHEIEGLSYRLVATVNATPDGPVRFDAIRISYD